MKEYYRLCLRHMGKNDNTFILWGKNNAGYFRSIEDSGLYEKNENSKDDPVIHKNLVDELKQKVVLPQYGENKETYADRNEFFVLANTGQVRKAIGITIEDIHLEGNRNSFTANFRDTLIEKFKWEYSKTSFRVKVKQCVEEFWYYDESFEAENRNKAISKAFKEWDFDMEMSYIDFKKLVTCSRERTKVFDKWLKLNNE